MTSQPVRAIAIVDGEHYPDVVRDALAELPYEFVGVMLVGGTEKLRGEPDYGVPIVERSAATRRSSSTSPTSRCSTPRARLALASRFLALGLPYVGADFRFDPPTFHPFDAAVARGDRHRQARRQDGRDRARRAAARARPARRRRRDGPWRAGGAGARSRRRRRVDDLVALVARRASRGVGPSRDRGARRRADGRLPPRRRRAWRARRSRRTCSRARGSPRRSSPTSSSSTAAAPRSRRSRRRAHPRRARPLAGLNAYRAPDHVVTLVLDGRREPTSRLPAAPGRAARAAASPSSRPAPRRPSISTPTSSTSRATSRAATLLARRARDASTPRRISSS